MLLPQVPSVMQRFVKHSDVQALLPDLGLPLIDFAAVPSSGATVVIDDDDTPNPGVSLVAMEGEGTSAPSHIPSPSPAPHELSQLRAHDVWAASRSTQSSSLTVLDIDEDETEHEHADNHVGEQIVPVQAAADQTQLAVRNVGWGGSRLTLQKLKDLKHDDFANMTAARCAIVGAQACASLRRMSEQLAVAKLAKRRLNRKLSVSASRATKQQSLQDAKSSNESTLVLQTGRSGKRLTPTATLALGIRRNIAHVAAADFGALLMVDLSGSTVIRSEIRTGAALAASMQDYTSDLMSVLRSTGRATVPGVDAPDLADIAYDESAWSLLVISVRADATHSSIWRREKLHVTEAELGLVTASLKSFPVSTDAFMKIRRCLHEPELSYYLDDCPAASYQCFFSVSRLVHHTRSHTCCGVAAALLVCVSRAVDCQVRSTDRVGVHRGTRRGYFAEATELDWSAICVRHRRRTEPREARCALVWCIMKLACVCLVG